MTQTTKLRSISIVFPAYNEEANVELAVKAAREVIAKYAEAGEILVVNDGSRDNTGAILNRLAEQDPSVIAIHHPRNQGYGAALRSGFSRARSEFVFFSDTDLQFDLDELKLLVPWIEQYDIVAGYRAKRADPVHRRLNAWSWNMLVRAVLGVRSRDIDCAFKLFRRRVFDGMQLASMGALINTEILAHAKHYGYTIKEVPVSHFSRRYGAQTGANIGVILRAFRELLKMHGRLRHATRSPIRGDGPQQQASQMQSQMQSHPQQHH